MKLIDEDALLQTIFETRERIERERIDMTQTPRERLSNTLDDIISLITRAPAVESVRVDSLAEQLAKWYLPPWVKPAWSKIIPQLSFPERVEAWKGVLRDIDEGA